ncbi:hypothetical protein LguiA_023919 [Lonicera macranthoides]
MERDYSGWFVKCRVDLDALMNAFPNSSVKNLDSMDLKYYKFATAISHKLFCHIITTITMLPATKRSSSSSADIIAGNDDLLTQILLHLPITSLLRFKSVSKHCLSLVSNPAFSLHLRNHTPPSGLFLRRSSFLINPEFNFVPFNTTKPPFTRLTFVQDPSGIKILQSCNGLLLCCSFHVLPINCNYYIYNPTINHFTTLPQPHYLSLKINRQFTYVAAVNLAFDPSKSPHYKAILVYTFDSLPQDHYEIQIYSSETGLWKRAGESFRAQVSFYLGVFWNGAINWSSRWVDSLYFNVEEEQIGTIPMPPIPEDFEERRLRYFGVSNNHLHLVEIYGPCTTIFNVYEMERDYSGWFVKFRVDLDALMNAFPESISRYLDPSDLHYYKFVILGLVRGEDDEDSFIVLHVPGKAILYRFRDRIFKKLYDFPPGQTGISVSDSYLEYCGWFDAFEFVESLSCV